MGFNPCANQTTIDGTIAQGKSTFIFKGLLTMRGGIGNSGKLRGIF
tara:strand:+ start:1224 stop:1361 length:138 start_codon:yes stop_codon:yes gene_type:complete